MAPSYRWAAPPTRTRPGAHDRRDRRCAPHYRTSSRDLSERGGRSHRSARSCRVLLHSRDAAGRERATLRTAWRVELRAAGETLANERGHFSQLAADQLESRRTNRCVSLPDFRLHELDQLNELRNRVETQQRQEPLVQRARLIEAAVARKLEHA